MKKPSALLLVAIVTLGLMIGFSVHVAKASSPGTLTLLKPTGSEEIIFYEKITVKFSVTDNFGWVYGGAWIYIGGVKVDTTSEGEYSPFEESYFPETYVGNQSVTVTAFFINYLLEEETISKWEYFTVKTCENTTDITDMRIDKLHADESGKGVLDGSGVTICIIGNLIGCETRSEEKFHESLYRTCKNELAGNSNRQYVNIEYYVWNDTKDEFEEQWEPGVDTREEKWQELYDEGEGDYNSVTDIHGTYTLSTLRRIAPAAKYMFISTEDDPDIIEESLYWLQENYFDLEFDILCVAYNGYAEWEDMIEDLADVGVITVCAAGNEGTTFTNSATGEYPACFDTVIGVTGVPDSNHGDSSDRWKRDNRANSGYGIDTAAIYYASELDWEPIPNKSEFFGTSNSAPTAAGILALLEQYQDSYKPTTDLTVSIIQDLLEETGDEPGEPPSYNTTESIGYLDWIDDEGSSPYYPNFPYSSLAPYTTYNIGWGIIDGYEMYEYFKQNY